MTYVNVSILLECNLYMRLMIPSKNMATFWKHSLCSSWPLLYEKSSQQFSLVFPVFQYLCFCLYQGISFLEVKYEMLLSYLVNLTYILLQKSNGESIAGDKAVERLVEIRTVSSSWQLIPRHGHITDPIHSLYHTDKGFFNLD